jgi:hypothetical protein
VRTKCALPVNNRRKTGSVIGDFSGRSLYAEERSRHALSRGLEQSVTSKVNRIPLFPGQDDRLPVPAADLSATPYAPFAAAHE